MKTTSKIRNIAKKQSFFQKGLDNCAESIILNIKDADCNPN